MFKQQRQEIQQAPLSKVGQHEPAGLVPERVPHDRGRSIQAAVPAESLAGRLRGHVALHRNLQVAFGGVMEAASPGAAHAGELAADHYELGVDVGAAEVLRYAIPLLAEVVDGNPLADERLRHLLGDLRSARRELVGDDEPELAA